MNNFWSLLSQLDPAFNIHSLQLSKEQEKEISDAFESILASQIKLNLISLKKQLKNLQVLFDFVWDDLDEFKRQRLKICIINSILEVVQIRACLGLKDDDWSSSKRINLEFLGKIDDENEDGSRHP